MSYRTWWVCGILFITARALAAPAFIEFESGPVRPLASSPDKSKLFAVNTPDGRLAIFDVTADGLALAGEVQVGMEPVAVAARTDDEVWVVNHLSDSVSIVDVPTRRVVRTLLVGDEPRDIVFAGPGRNRVFITTAHRGQHRVDPSLAGVTGAGDPQLTTPGVGRADVWVFDATGLGDGVGGRPLEILTLFADTPRALAVSPDGATVYAAGFHTGNQTTTISAGAVCVGFDAAGPCMVDGAMMPGGSPGPSKNAAGASAPHVGLIVKRDSGGAWRDELGRDWSGAVRFSLPDYDVFAIDAATLATTTRYAGVGTTLFNMIVNPVDGTLYVSNQESRNENRFEGPGTFAGHTVQGHLAEARITLIRGTTVTPRRINTHIDYDQRPAAAGTSDKSLATPLDMVLSSDGATLYVAAFGSSRIGVIPTADLAAGTFDPTSASTRYIDVPGGGPAGLVLDEARGRLYVLSRFANAVEVIDLASRGPLGRAELFNPEPPEVIVGRSFLYEARTTSSNGEASCSSCHVFGDLDQLAWDLGNPDDVVTQSPIEVKLGIAATQFSPPINGTGRTSDFHPMKGPMTTQTLRGLVYSGAMHWRGDRATGAFGTAPADSTLAFKNFVVAFQGLLGRATPMTEAEMDAFTAFALTITLPPNPIRALDNVLTASEQRGRNFYTGSRLSDGVPGFGFNCNGCHELAPAAGHYGTGTTQSFENEPQIMKVPHLRNAYQKVGMFGMPQVGFFETMASAPTGDQVRGFGFLHDGSTDTLFRFFHATVFSPNSNAGFNGGDAQRRDVEAFALAFDTDLAPIVGQQVTLRADNGDVAGPRIDLLQTRARMPFVSRLLGEGVTECDVIAKARIGDRVRGFLLQIDGTYATDDGSPAISDASLRAYAVEPGSEITYTAVPPGSGRRLGLDRDLDGALDGVDGTPGEEPEDGGCGCRSNRSNLGGYACLWLLLLVRRGRGRRRRSTHRAAA